MMNVFRISLDRTRFKSKARVAIHKSRSVAEVPESSTPTCKTGTGQESGRGIEGGACKTVHRAARNLLVRGSLSARKAEFGAKVPGENSAFPLKSLGS